MEHPLLFEEDDPIVDRVRGICAEYPEFAEKMAWGRPTFRAGAKLFVVMGSSMDRPHTMVFKPDPDERPAFLEDDRFFVPPYFGLGGWLGIDLEHIDTDWAFVAELIDESYRQIALKRQLAALEDRHLR